ncbi:hypothetical protein DFA_01866 [Cavenderia fasciculata]|uniref:Uncharacterized protein n=1 Tax=Cavenderia fasciculata TaxID=261658 RepID=F4PV72_CACFS|nr:uncharacterized protein DFA_01866 [Cavenderia fasciculata]EGG21980.1 hypothetical protein DFA_01866 [Cavenderia fasciculata]|eukprot:XP_004359831.1 hypothetical protein DFA_01866 [Cavenderia fasciculata]
MEMVRSYFKAGRLKVYGTVLSTEALALAIASSQVG